MKNLAILGSTGSIGRQTLEVVSEHPDRFRVQMICANSSADLLVEQALRFDVKEVVICREDLYDKVRSALPSRIGVHAGADAACALVSAPEVDIVVAAMVGFSGFRPTLAAIDAGKTIALANKETLVAGGSIVMRRAKQRGVAILPVDSEHSAIFQCLRAADGNEAVKLHLTASGGPFREWSAEQMASARKEQALKHPNWVMGAKITIDSATMMNKGLEVIEARWLFDMAPERIHVVVHPESVIHSMVEFSDGAVLAQLGLPDMRLPIQLALSFPERLSLSGERLDFGKLRSMHFYEAQPERFPCLGLAYEALSRGGNIPCAMNAANEAAVAAFLKDEIGFMDIPKTIRKVMDSIPFCADPDTEDLLQTHSEAFRKAREAC
ncbi:MAG: 1-deoxy-D-xylulose-5-phosphate reductoisomerase [Bacteroidales bacterium]|nr:1-deoxy-D-xylulose-5-phosphate reductoisomerase [Bacteroidales bacterium]